MRKQKRGENMNRYLAIFVVLMVIGGLGVGLACETPEPEPEPVPCDQDQTQDQTQDQDQNQGQAQGQTQVTDVDNLNANANANDNKNNNVNTNVNTATSSSKSSAKNINNIGIVVYTFNKQGQLQAQGQIQGQAQGQAQGQIQGQAGLNEQQQQQAIECPKGFVPCLGQDGCIYYVPESTMSQGNATASAGMQETGGNFVGMAIAGCMGAVGMVGAAKAGILTRIFN